MPYGAAPLELQLVTPIPKTRLQMRLDEHFANMRVVGEQAQHICHARAVEFVVGPEGFQPNQIPAQGWDGRRATARDVFKGEIADG